MNSRELLVGLARADRLRARRRAGAPACTSCVRRSSTTMRCQPNGERTGARQLVDLELGHRLLELGHRVAGIDPAEVAALRRRRVLGIDARLVRELARRCRCGRATRSIFALPSVSDVVSFTRTRMWRTCVCSTTVGCVAAARVVELHDVEAAGAAQHRRDVALLHVLQRRRRTPSGSRAGVRQPRSPPLHRILRIGVLRRDLAEILAALDRGQRFLGAAPARARSGRAWPARARRP